MKDVQIFPDIDAISVAVAKKWAALSGLAIKQRGGFHVALSGGSTPRCLYNYLATSEYKASIDWHNTHIYFGDERPVPPSHEDSNFNMANRALFEKVGIPDSQIYRMQADAPDIEKSAEAYANLLKSRLPASEYSDPQFDLVLLGMGDDGHTASLFPRTSILKEKSELVRAVYVEKMKTWRMSITFPAINNASNIAVMVTGENKKKILSQVLDVNATHALYPIMMIQPRGHMQWYLDILAANEDA